MPYKRVDPVTEQEIFEIPEPTEAEMFREAHPGHHTVCQTLRDAYQLTDQEDCKAKLRLAWAMMKKMNDRLHYYKNKYEPWRGRHA